MEKVGILEFWNFTIWEFGDFKIMCVKKQRVCVCVCVCVKKEKKGRGEK